MADIQPLGLATIGAGSQQSDENDDIVLATIKRLTSGNASLWTDNVVSGMTIGGGSALTSLLIDGGSGTLSFSALSGSSVDFNEAGSLDLRSEYTSSGFTSIVGALNALVTSGSGVSANSSASLQSAYTEDNTITTSSAEGDLIIAGTEAFNVTTSGALNLGGSSTGTLTIGNGSAGAMTIDTGSTLSIDSAGSSNLSTSSGILTLDGPTVNVGPSTATVVNLGTGSSITAVNIGDSSSTTTVNDELVVTGNLTVSGTTTTVNTNNLTIEDQLILLNSDGTSPGPAGQDSGIAIERGSTGDDAIVLWEEGNDRFQLGLGDTTQGSSVPIITEFVSLEISGLFLENSTTGATVIIDSSNGGTGSTDNDLSIIAGGTLNLGASSETTQIDVGNDANAKTINLGNATGSTSLNINSGTSGTTIDSTGAISIDAVTASNLTVSGATADLTLGARGSTITLNESGSESLTSEYTSAGFDSLIGSLNALVTPGSGVSANSSASSQTAYEQNNTITTSSSEGSFTITGTEAFNVTTTGALNLGGSSTGAIVVGNGSAGAVTIDSGAGVSIGAATASDFTVTNANLTLETTSSGVLSILSDRASSDSIVIAAGHASGGIDIDSGSLGIAVDTTGAFSVDGATDSNITVTGSAQDLTLAAAGGGAQVLNINSAGTGANAIDINATAGGIDIDSSAGFTVDAGAAISFDTSAASNFTVTGASADLTLGARGSTITLNESGETTLSGFTNSSIVGALNELKAAAATPTLQQAYVAGNAIVTDATNGDFDVSGTEEILLVSSGNGMTFEVDASSGGTIDINAEHISAGTIQIDANDVEIGANQTLGSVSNTITIGRVNSGATSDYNIDIGILAGGVAITQEPTIRIGYSGAITTREIHLGNSGQVLNIAGGGATTLDEGINIDSTGTMAISADNTLDLDVSGASAAAIRMNLNASNSSTNIGSIGEINLDASSGINLTCTEVTGGPAGSGSIRLEGTGDMFLTAGQDGTGGMILTSGTNVQINSSVNSNFTVTGSAQNLTLEAAGGGAQVVAINSAGTGTNAIDLDASAGGIRFDAHGMTTPLTLNTSSETDLANFTSSPISIVEALNENRKQAGVMTITTSIDLKSTGTTTLRTGVSGENFITTAVNVRITAASAITVGATVSVGQDGSTNADIVADTTLTGLLAVDEGFLLTPFGGKYELANGSDITFEVVIAATGTSQTATVDLVGYII